MSVSSKLKSAYNLASHLHTSARAHIAERQSERDGQEASQDSRRDQRGERLTSAGREALMWGRVLGQATWEWAREQPEIMRRVERAEERIDELRRRAQAHVQQLEEELWAWVRTLEEEAPSPRLSGPTLSECYATLNISSTASDSELRRAWKRLMVECHPDRHAQDPSALERAERKARLVNEAYQTVCRARGL